MNTSLYYIVFLALFSVLAGAQVWLSHLRLATSQDMTLLQHDIDKEQEEIRALKLEYASLSSPNRLRQRAQHELGMRAPSPMQVLRP